MGQVRSLIFASWSWNTQEFVKELTISYLSYLKTTEHVVTVHG